ncbi:MAG: preprotein translocase subunit TatC [Planctomycetes bacterium]|nr:preprotein translocase subunit TatC [Planctomycetota bacterium]
MVRFDDTSMPLGDHIEELRRRLIFALAGIAVGMAVCLLLGRHIMAVMFWPAAVAMRLQGVSLRVWTLAPAEGFVTYVKVCLICGAILAAPYSLRQLWLFIAAGLHEHEQRYVRRYVPFSAVLFALGVAFFMAVIAPICLSFFLGFGARNFPMPAWASPVLPAQPPAATQPATQPVLLPILADAPADAPDGAAWIDRTTGAMHWAFDGSVRTAETTGGTFLASQYRLGEYVTFIAWLSLVFGIAFQTPIFVLVLARAGIVPLETMRHYRRHIILGLLIVAATLTPPDVVSQLALAAPMYVLFELGLLLARRRRRNPTGVHRAVEGPAGPSGADPARPAAKDG